MRLAAGFYQRTPPEILYCNKRKPPSEIHKFQKGLVRVLFKDLTELRGTEQYRIRIISVSHL